MATVHVDFLLVEWNGSHSPMGYKKESRSQMYIVLSKDKNEIPIYAGENIEDVISFMEENKSILYRFFEEKNTDIYISHIWE